MPKARLDDSLNGAPARSVKPALLQPDCTQVDRRVNSTAFRRYLGLDFLLLLELDG